MLSRISSNVAVVQTLMSSEAKPTIASIAQEARYLLLATEDGGQGEHSGYTRLTEYINQSLLVAARRTNRPAFVERAMMGILARFATSSWYGFGSVKIETRAWWASQTGFKGLVHYLWAERDLGFLDRVPAMSMAPLCATFHSCPDTLPEVLRDTRRLRYLAAVILMSEVQRPFFEACGVTSERIHIIHHGIDCRYFSPKSSPRSRGFTVLSVGSYRRNFRLLRKVCAMLEPYVDIRIKVIAPKYNAAAFEDAKNVTVVSNISDGDLLASYQEASCLLMTLDAATANNAVLEAMACGVPIVSENVGGIAEYTGPRCALLCKAGSADVLTQSILALYNNPSMIACLGSRARERAKELDWPVVAERTVRLYEKVLTERCAKNM
jgi:glycosyltransferase involved in cell wall biosynthesis